MKIMHQHDHAQDWGVLVLNVRFHHFLFDLRISKIIILREENGKLDIFYCDGILGVTVEPLDEPELVNIAASHGRQRKRFGQSAAGTRLTMWALGPGSYP